MNQAEFIKELAEKVGITEVIAKKMLEASAGIVAEQLKAGNSVVLHAKLGEFSAKNKPERQGRNPKNGEPITIEACVKPSFRVSGFLKKSLN